MEPQHIHEDVPGGVPLKLWTQGVPVEDSAKRQLQLGVRFVRLVRAKQVHP